MVFVANSSMPGTSMGVRVYQFSRAFVHRPFEYSCVGFFDLYRLLVCVCSDTVLVEWRLSRQLKF